MCLGGRQSTPAPTNVKDNSMYYNGNVFDPLPEEEQAAMIMDNVVDFNSGEKGKNKNKQSYGNSSGLGIGDPSDGGINI